MRDPVSAPPPADPLDVLDAEFLASASALDQLTAPALAEVAFAGRSNVGKSSLMNAVMQRKGLVRTSSTPGCTRGVNLFRARFRSGLELSLVDLPGYGFAKRSKAERKVWGPLLEGYLLGRPTLRAVILLVDIRRGIEDDDIALLTFCAQHRPGLAPMTTLVVVTKTDMVSKAKRKPELARIEAVLAAGCLAEGIKTPKLMGMSAETNDNRPQLVKTIDFLARGEKAPIYDAVKVEKDRTLDPT